MLLLDAGGPIPDLWLRVGEGEPLPPAGRALVEPDRLAEALAAGLSVGLHIANDTDPADLVPHFPRLVLISVAFPSFADGRGFSIARRLRRLGYTGRLRASGPVIADQFADLLGCGFDEVAIPQALADRQPAQMWMAQLGRIPLGYQRGLAGRGSILDRRAGRG